MLPEVGVSTITLQISMRLDIVCGTVHSECLLAPPPPSPQVRTMAAVLLRRVFIQMEYKDLMEDLSVSMLSSCQAELLAAIQSESSSSI